MVEAKTISSSDSRQMQGRREDNLDVDLRDFLEDSLTYSPLKDVTNKENSPSLFFSNIERARKSPSTARLFAILGGGPGKPEILPSPSDLDIRPRRLQDFLDTPDKLTSEKTSPFEVKRSVFELTSEVAALRSSLTMIQKDCEFHRQRAVSAHDQVDHLNKYIGLLEEENRKVGLHKGEASSLAQPTDDAEKLQLRMSIESMEALNRSLARQNDLLRRRSSVSARFSCKDVKVQTEEIYKVTVGTDPLVADLSELDLLPFLPTPLKTGLTPASGIPVSSPHSNNIRVSRIYVRDSDCQTDKGIWASVEELAARLPPAYHDLRVPSEVVSALRLPIPKRSGYPSNTAMRSRRSLPSSYPMSPYSNPIGGSSVKSIVPKPLLAPSRRSVKSVCESSSSVFHSRKEWKQTTAKRGKSTGAVSRPRPRWIP